MAIALYLEYWIWSISIRISTIINLYLEIVLNSDQYYIQQKIEVAKIIQELTMDYIQKVSLFKSCHIDLIK